MVLVGKSARQMRRVFSGTERAGIHTGGRESGVSERVRGDGFGVFFTTVSAMGKPSGRRGVLRDTGVRGWASGVGQSTYLLFICTIYEYRDGCLLSGLKWWLDRCWVNACGRACEPTTYYHFCHLP